MPPVPPRRRRARPVADAPVDALLLRGEELARGWLLALLEQAPLQAAPAILTTDLAREAPRLCDALVRALGDDRDLRRLEAGGALRELAARTGRLAGAGDPVAAARAVDALCAVVWSALLEELRRPDGDLVADLTQRLGQVGETIRDAVLSAQTSSDEDPEGRARATAPLAALPDPDVVAGPPPPPPPPPAARQRPPEDGVLPAWPGLGDRSPRVAEHETLWMQALEDEIRRAEPGALALLAAELEDAERIAAGETEPESPIGRFTAAVRSAVRRNDILVSETDARAWIIARDTGRPGAQALAQRIGEALRGSPPWRGAPLVASIGVAVLGQDGRTAAELIDAAEEARFAAAADGVDVLGVDDPLG